MSNKLHPALNAMYQMLANRDYYGVKIRNEDVVAAVLATISVMRVYSADAAQTAMLKVQVDALEQRVARDESRLDKSDERWDAIKEDLAKIKERLSIVEARPVK